MPLSIHVKATKRLHPESHAHNCPICKKVRVEPNEVCEKTLRDTGLDSHRFPCLLCQSDWRTRFGLDAVTAYLDEYQAAMLTKVWPSAKVEQREQVEALRGDEDAKAVRKIAEKL